MGIYLNPGYENFRRTLAAKIYVDKTMMIAETNRMIDEGSNYICISRPRRFGKTIAGEMLSAYYSKGCDAGELFAPYKIAADPSFEEKRNCYHVIKLDMNSEYQNVADREHLIHELTKEIRDEMREEFQEVAFSEEDSLARCILRVFHATGEQFVIIIDEYDVLVREQASEELFASFLSFLNGMFKSATVRPAIALAYLTGILPVVRDKIQSKLNNFEEYTILDAMELAEYVGFTEPEVRSLCEQYGMDFAECKRWYDGYHQHGYEIYNPESVVKCMLRKKYGNYWSKTSTYRVISDYLAKDFDGMREGVLRMLSGEPVDVIVTTFLNTMDSFSTKDDVFTYLIHVGYLAFELYDEMYMYGYCRIPNNEIRQEWYSAIAVDENYTVTDAIIKASRQLLEATVRGDEAAVAAALDVSHIHVTSNRSYNNEDALQSAIYLAYIYALNKYTVVKEMTTGKGFADVVFIPFVEQVPAMIIELKRNGSADSAIDQIRQTINLRFSPSPCNSSFPVYSVPLFGAAVGLRVQGANQNEPAPFQCI